MKICIVTLHRVKNYGSVLQAYATQKKLEQLGFQVEFADYWRRDNIDRNLLSAFLESSHRWNHNKLTRFVYLTIKGPSVRKRIRVFNNFLSRRIHLSSKRYETLQELKEDPPQGDFYCTGSDQVWNSNWNRGLDPVFFLDFVPQGKPRVAFSASFGKAKLASWEEEKTRKLLQKYRAVSVREKSGIEILNRLKISGCQLPDPTLILETEEWKSIAEPRTVRYPYLLLYQLNPNPDMDWYAKQLAKRMDRQLVRVGYSYDDIRKPGRLICCPSVETWLSLFLYADYVVTDSFHGTVFSIQFQRPFTVFYPPQFSTRLQSVLRITGLEDRVLTAVSAEGLADRPINFTNVGLLLKKERRRADTFLKEAFQCGKEGADEGVS